MLQQLLAGELRAIGLADVTLDEHGYLMATIPATTVTARCRDRSGSSRTWTRRRRCRARTSSRSSTAPGTAATSCCPTIRPRSSAPPTIRELAAQIGHDIVTASGTTLLGADDKAGVAIDRGGGRVPDGASGDSARPDPHRLHAGRGDRPRRGPVRRRAVRRRLRLHARRRQRRASWSSRASPPT